MAKRAIVILAEGFEEIEAVTPIDIMRRAGIEVTVAGLAGYEVKASRSVKIICDKKLSEAGDDFDACVFPGGLPGAENLAASKEVSALIEKMNHAQKIIAAICASPAVVLAPSGILDGKVATCYPGTEDNLKDKADYRQDNVVIDGNIITSRGPATALLFSLAIVEQLVGKEVAEKVSKATLTT